LSLSFSLNSAAFLSASWELRELRGRPGNLGGHK
jgi:hypothetical protein